MFGDIIKFGVRTGAVLAVMGIILGVMAAIQIPTPDYSVFSDIIGKGYAMLTHWVPGFPALWSVFTITFGTWLVIQAARFAIYTSSIVLKIFQ